MSASRPLHFSKMHGAGNDFVVIDLRGGQSAPPATLVRTLGDRHFGVGFDQLLGIEDTDAARDSEESFRQLVDALTWLKIDWDEGVEVGGPHAPYR